MKEATEQMANWITSYYGNGAYAVLTICAALYLYVHCKESRKKLIYPSLFILVCLLCPVLYAKVFWRITYWRFFWLLPSGVFISYAVTRLVMQLDKISGKLFLLAICGIINATFGTNMYLNGVFQKTQNIQKVSVATKSVCDIMLSEEKYPQCIVPSGIYCEVRQYSGDIEMMFGRDADGYINDTEQICIDIRNTLDSEAPDYDLVLSTASERGYEFVAVYDTKPIDKKLLKKYGYKKLAQSSGYIVYRIK